MQPVRVSERGFYDGAEHRLELTSAYNQYQRISSDAAYRAESENYKMLLRPLFITSFMLADFLDDNAFFGARQILMRLEALCVGNECVSTCRSHRSPDH